MNREQGMIEKKSLYWFLGITYLISWPLFLAPLALNSLDPLTYQLSVQIMWAIGMWGPGIAAIIATVIIAKRPLRSLNLHRLGPKRYYLWAWFLPLLLAIVTGLFTLLFRIGILDTQLELIRQSMQGLPEIESINPWLIVGIQGLVAVLVAPFFNIIFALGEELGWRGFLLPNLLPLGQWPAILLSGLIWGFWHTPAIVQGLNYPGYPIAGVLMMIVFCILIGTIFSWLYLKTRSPWAPALAHGSLNAVAGLTVLFLEPGFDMAIGGTLPSLVGWIGIAIFIGFLVWTKQLPTQKDEQIN
jgi:membrane protease YdiL (CAAX protease family)